jgi:hypothetical protein
MTKVSNFICSPRHTTARRKGAQKMSGRRDRLHGLCGKLEPKTNEMRNDLKEGNHITCCFLLSWKRSAQNSAVKAGIDNWYPLTCLNQEDLDLET